MAREAVAKVKKTESTGQEKCMSLVASLFWVKELTNIPFLTLINAPEPNNKLPTYDSTRRLMEPPLLMHLL